MPANSEKPNTRPRFSTFVGNVKIPFTEISLAYFFVRPRREFECRLSASMNSLGPNLTDNARSKRGVWRSVRKFVASEDGPTAVEYAVMLAFIITVCFAAISNVGTATSAKWSDNNTKLNNAGFNHP